MPAIAPSLFPVSSSNGKYNLGGQGFSQNIEVNSAVPVKVSSTWLSIGSISVKTVACAPTVLAPSSSVEEITLFGAVPGVTASGLIVNIVSADGVQNHSQS